MTLLETFALFEMARTRGEATWQMLDWCAFQKGDFTLSDAYRIYTSAGGTSSRTAFSTLFNNFVAKYDPKSPNPKFRNKAEFGVSDQRPILISKQGFRGPTGAASYRWGLDHPLRTPPEASFDNEQDDDPVSIAMDKLEDVMGGPALKNALTRWRKMDDIRKITADIRGLLKPRYQMDAILVATQHLVSSGKADEEDVEAAEKSLQTATPSAAAHQDQPQVADEPEAFDDPSAEWEDDSADKTDPDAAAPDFSDLDSAQEPVDQDSSPESDHESEYQERPEDDDFGQGPTTAKGAKLPIIMKKGTKLVQGTITWPGGSAQHPMGNPIMQDSTGKKYGPDWAVQIQGEEVYSEKMEQFTLWMADNLKLALEKTEGGPDWEEQLGDQAAGRKVPDVSTELESSGPPEDATIDPDDPQDVAEDEPSDEAEEPAEAEAEDDGIPDEYDVSDYPDWLPPANRLGSRGEKGMHLLVSPRPTGGSLQPEDRLWKAIDKSDDYESAESAITDLFRRTDRYDRKLLPAALAVAKEVLSGVDEDEDEPAEAESEEESPEDSDEQEDSDEDEDSASGSRPEWLPNSDEDGSNAEAAMYRLEDEGGLDAEDQFFKHLRSAKNSVDAHSIIRASKLPANLNKAALTVARSIFDHDGRDWDTGKGGTKKESRSLRSFFRV